MDLSRAQEECGLEQCMNRALFSGYSVLLEEPYELQRSKLCLLVEGFGSGIEQLISATLF